MGDAVTRWVCVWLALAACTGKGRGADGEPAGAGAADSGAATPVTVATVRRATLALTITAPGHTDVLRPLRVRAPFTGSLTALAVADGDRVTAGQSVGAVVARASAAAVAGARAMLDAASSDTERRDAQRALELANQNLVAQALRSPEAGVVVSHAANAGDLVSEGDEVLTIAPAGAIAFIAQVVQSDLPRVRPGLRVAVELPSRGTPLAGTVHGILPTASTENLNAPVRIDLPGFAGGIGLFGTAHITVDVRRDVPAVPAAAVLRDDVYGTARVAVVTAERRVQWVTVTTGASEGGLVEIVAPSLVPGTRVIVAGQVGLPEGAPVRPAP